MNVIVTIPDLCQAGFVHIIDQSKHETTRIKQLFLKGSHSMLESESLPSILL